MAARSTLLRWFVPVNLGLACLLLAGCGKPSAPPANIQAGTMEIDAENDESNIDPEPYLGIAFTKDQRFGIVLPREKAPNFPGKFKKLTFAEDGATNNTCVKLDGNEFLYGQAPGNWARDLENKQLLNGMETIPGRKWVSAWDYPEKVRVTQTVMLLPGVQTRKLDSALIHYTIENRDTMPHKLGIRFMLHIRIGAEGGATFAIPGEAELLTTKREFNNPKCIPDFIQITERPNLSDPGTRALLDLRFPPDFGIDRGDPLLDPIVRVLICRWPGDPQIRWDFTKGPDSKFWGMNDKSKGERNDSCAVLYWEERIVPPKSKRVMAFAYGLDLMRCCTRAALGGTSKGEDEPSKSK